MLFNSYEFLFYFLPLTAGVFFLLSAGHWVRTAGAWLALMSLAFYAFWNPVYLALLLGSVAFNFMAGRWLLASLSGASALRAKPLLTGAVATNLLLLGYFKYANFFLGSVNAALGSHLAWTQVVLPLGISFFTFTQIAFLVDTYRGKVQEARLIPYVLFVTYFPHLIAGPVLHHSEMMPQFGLRDTYRFRLDNFLSGSVLFLIGLCKKIILADGIQPFVAPVFDGGSLHALTGVEAWGGVLAYTLQLYFDFSAYSDMAIGLSRLFNVELPLNFNSPYKSANIIEFWRRWHMTLSRFLRDYLYIALGGNRGGPSQRYINLMLTMVLGGLWHGAGWTFVIWGGLHGLYLMVNHGWQAIRRRLGRPSTGTASPWGHAVSVLVTFLAVALAWVFFRATSLEDALRVLKGMAGLNGWVLPMAWRPNTQTLIDGTGLIRYDDLVAFAGLRQIKWTVCLLAIALFAPNSQELMARWTAWHPGGQPASRGLAWGLLGAVAVLVLGLVVLNASVGVSEFIYFNF